MSESVGRINNYVCESCEHVVVTLNLNTGTTPFGIKCTKCGGHECYSEFYCIRKTSPIELLWYRPDEKELRDMYPSTINHVLGGGLIHKELKDAVCADWELEDWNEYAKAKYPNLGEEQ